MEIHDSLASLRGDTAGGLAQFELSSRQFLDFKFIARVCVSLTGSTRDCPVVRTSGAHHASAVHGMEGDAIAIVDVRVLGLIPQTNANVFAAGTGIASAFQLWCCRRTS